MASEIVHASESRATPALMVLGLLVRLDVAPQGVLGLEGHVALVAGEVPDLGVLVLMMHLQRLLGVKSGPAHLTDEVAKILKVQCDVSLQIVLFPTLVAAVLAGVGLVPGVVTDVALQGLLPEQHGNIHSITCSMYSVTGISNMAVVTIVLYCWNVGS